MTLTFDEIAAVLGTRRVGDGIVRGISLDSRTTEPGDLFCAIVGANHDGHNFISQAVERGAVAVMTTRTVASPVPRFVVESIEDGLAKIALVIRATFGGKVAGITGSVGKTSVKEYLSGAVQDEFVLKSPGNLNTEFGLPKVWMMLDSRARFAVLEMAMRGPRQIAHLCSFSKPQYGVISSLGTAHIGELGSREAIAEAKCELLRSLPQSGFATVPADDGFLDLMSESCGCPFQTFGFSEDADWRVAEWETDWKAGRTRAHVLHKSEKFQCDVEGMGSAAARNAAAALACAVSMGVDAVTASQAMMTARIPAGRMKSLFIHGAQIIVDVYNSSPESCSEAIANLERIPAAGKRVAILGDMRELGEFSKTFHLEIGERIAKSNIDCLIVVGEEAALIGKGAEDAGFRGEIEYLKTAIEARPIVMGLREGSVALLKASRAVELEKALPESEVKLA